MGLDDELAAHVAAVAGTVAGSSGIIADIVARLWSCFDHGGKLLICGNGGSAADAQHVAAEFVGRFARERAAWPAMALTTNTSILTAIGNDYSFDRVFARQVEAFAVPGDVIVGISTSGNAANVIAAMKTARELGCQTIGFTGENGGRLKDGVDICLHAPSNVTARIQEVHIVVWHIVCEMIEQELSAEKP
jgi:D-sedoheptulose 7-phosphate isomerase